MFNPAESSERIPVRAKSQVDEFSLRRLMDLKSSIVLSVVRAVRSFRDQFPVCNPETIRPAKKADQIRP
jgi:hypothetical protein